MNLGAWLATFRDLHERAKAGKLSQKEAVEYRMAREELARAMLAAHRLSLKPGETPRAALRVARALQVDLDWTVGGTRGHDHRSERGRHRRAARQGSTAGRGAEVHAAARRRG